MTPTTAAEGYEGVVSAFDVEVGLGQIRAQDGSLIGFHCVAVFDGSRRVEVGARVRFGLTPGLHGRWEGTSVTPFG